MASTSSTPGITSKTRGRNGLCLLSLDGGGVRGLSTLLILKGIMQQINSTRQHEGLSNARPCDIFDLIGGTSTGGLIAIMLGRLQMDIQPCIDAYSNLSRLVFHVKGLPVDWRGRIKGQFKASELEAAIKDIIKASGLPDSALFDDRKDRGCRTFVCAVRKENKAVARLRGYQSKRALIDDHATIWEAARATSAASGFFDSISIGQHGQEYIDAGLGCNNPVDEVWTEAQDIWSPEEGDLATIVKCFVSIGTGNPGTSPVEDNALKILMKTLKEIALETEKTAETFIRSHRDLFSQQRYFRFNVDQGLQGIGLEEYKREKGIASATSTYMESEYIQSYIRSCSQAMKGKEFWKGEASEMIPRILRENQRTEEQFQVMFSLAAAPEISYFVGRVGDLSSIESKILPIITADRRVVVLYGLGGIGKSQLAIEYAKKHRNHYTAIFWLNAKTEDTLKRSFAAGARRLPQQDFDQGLLYGSQNDEALSVILRGMKAWFDRPGNHRWLLIFDNVDNPKLPDNKRLNAYDIRSYFPEVHQGSILVTTRWKTLRLGHLVEVAKLSKVEDSISLLEKTSGISSGQDSGLRKIANQLDGLPLALATAGSYLGLTSMPASEYLRHHENSWLQLQRDSPELPSYEDQRIFTTWNLSYIYIRKEDEPAAKLLELWAYFDNQDLWYDLLKAGKDDQAPDWFHRIVGTELAFKAAVTKLQKHALVERLADSDGYSMHHCVHAWVKNVLFKTIEDQNMVLVLACVGEVVPLQAARGDWVMNQRLLPHSERCLKLIEVWDQECRITERSEICIAQFLALVGKLYFDQGRLFKAESVFSQALATYEKVYGSDNLSTLGIVNSLAGVYKNQGRLTKAESMLKQVLAGFENELGQDDEHTLTFVTNLISLYLRQGKLTEVESMSQRALSGYTKLFGPDHYHTLDVVSGLGNLCRERGKLTEAESMFQRASSGYEKVLGPDHEYTLNAFLNTGLLYRKQGKLVEAEKMCQRALNGYARNPPPDPKHQLYLFSHMGLLYRYMQRFEEAKHFFRQSYEGFQELLEPNDEETIRVLNELNREIERSAQRDQSH